MYDVLDGGASWSVRYVNRQSRLQRETNQYECNGPGRLKCAVANV